MCRAPLSAAGRTGRRRDATALRVRLGLVQLHSLLWRSGKRHVTPDAASQNAQVTWSIHVQLIFTA